LSYEKISSSLSLELMRKQENSLEYLSLFDTQIDLNGLLHFDLQKLLQRTLQNWNGNKEIQLLSDSLVSLEIDVIPILY
jgi:hypothetical protein